jgi:hypothetical protein
MTSYFENHFNDCYSEFSFHDQENLNFDEEKNIFQINIQLNENKEEDDSLSQRIFENLAQKENENQKSNPIEYYPLEKIKEELEKNGINILSSHMKNFSENEIQKNIRNIVIILTVNIKERVTINKELLKLKKERDEENNSVKKCLGRPKKGTPSTNSKGTHNKNSHDNIIRKIKTLIINIIRKYLNNIHNIDIKDTDFKTSKNVVDLVSNRETLMNPISQFFKTATISKKYKKISKEYNKKIIETIEKGNDIKKKQLLEMSLHDYLDIITLKNKNHDLKDFPNLKQIIEEITSKLQNDSKKDALELSKYIIRFVLLLFNYEKYLYSKEPRKIPNKNKSNIIL